MTRGTSLSKLNIFSAKYVVAVKNSIYGVILENLGKLSNDKWEEKLIPKLLCPQELSKKKQKEIFQSVNNATV